MAGLSPGKYTQTYAEQCAKKRKHCQDMMQQTSTKRRRLILKQERTVHQLAQESLEGSSYQPGIGHDEEVDIEKLPDPVPRGNFKPVASSGPPTFLVLDLETTDLIRGSQLPHITQIAALAMRTRHTFNRYVLPKVPISAAAEKVTKICMTGENSMVVGGLPVKPVPLPCALSDFLLWLEHYSDVYLVAHNGRRFDFIVLLGAFKACGLLTNVLSHVTGMVDSIPVFKQIFPRQQSYKQDCLAHNLLGIEYNAHNAEDDVNCLSELLSLAKASDDKCLVTKSFSPIDVVNNMEAGRERKKNLPSLSLLVAAGVMKMPTAEHVASSGLNIFHLKTIYNRKGEDGLWNVFTMKNSEGQARVTNVKKTLESVVPRLAAYFEKSLEE